MKKLLLALLFLSSSLTANAEDKFLAYQFNERVIIKISNIPCPNKKIVGQFPLTAIAFRIDGAKMMGCFAPKEDDIVIQWWGGDTTTIPANAFLNPNQPEFNGSKSEAPKVWL